MKLSTSTQSSFCYLIDVLNKWLKVEKNQPTKWFNIKKDNNFKSQWEQKGV